MTETTNLQIVNLHESTHPLERKLAKECLKAAVMRKIFCSCGQILDVRRAVLADLRPEGKTPSMIIGCGSCWDSSLDALAALSEKIPVVVEVTDGRKMRR